MKAACFLTNSTYALAVSDRGRMGIDVLGSEFTSTGVGAGGDEIIGAESTRRGGVSEIIVETETAGSGIIVGMEASVGTSFDCALPASLVPASDLRACRSPDSIDSWLVLRVVGVWRFYNTSIGGNSVRSGTFSSGMGLPQKK